MDQQTLLAVLTALMLVQRQMLLTLELLMSDSRHITHTPSDTRHRIRQLAYFRMIHESDLVCHERTRMERRTFAILCHLLQTIFDLSSTEIVDVEKMVAMFLHVLAHDVKNRVIQREFVWFGETVSRHFNLVLITLGALDGMYIKMNVPAADRPTFRTRKRKTATNIRGFRLCPRQLERIHGYYYLCDAGYPNAEGFLGPYRGQQYHLQEWCGAGNASTNAKEYFNMKHSSCRTILACCLLHNLINREMTYSDDVDDVDKGDSAYATTTAIEDIHYIETINEWFQWRDELAESMFTDWQLRNA
ncbi:retrotransposon protein [Cucumis melo var. makuwa]|uniref:Retrotransposon protein n=1 Tax=Cucumis melo var. makuwa TaxID=1194695 RepID=A0A5D3C478_CUCMM|nr:retrotransposon protein [Cucumis melo var. makuwa]TYK05179.1 retrotransposon protein [Cucumis melo var. makuwa]